MTENQLWFLILGIIIIVFFIIIGLIITFGDYVKCKECGKWHDMYDFECLSTQKPALKENKED